MQSTIRADWLADDELKRAERYAFDLDRSRFVVRRGVLRALLGAYLGLHPSHIRLETVGRGKPVLNRAHHPSVHFNVSFSRNQALFAFSQNVELGIDIEAVRTIPEMEALADSILSPGEKAFWVQLPPPEKEQAFCRFWTRKEAIVKGLGTGLGFPLNKIELSLKEKQEVRISDIQEDSWELHEIHAPEGFCAALAVREKVNEIVYLDWPSDFEIVNRIEDLAQAG